MTKIGIWKRSIAMYVLACIIGVDVMAQQFKRPYHSAWNKFPPLVLIQLTSNAHLVR